MPDVDRSMARKSPACIMTIKAQGKKKKKKKRGNIDIQQHRRSGDEEKRGNGEVNIIALPSGGRAETKIVPVNRTEISADRRVEGKSGLCLQIDQDER